MLRKRVRFGEFEVPVPRGYQQIIDKDETTEYLFINAPSVVLLKPTPLMEKK